jgi:hypothetical protein
MTDLVHRTEQALLGALIANPGHAYVLRLRPQDFTDIRHQAIYAALTDTSARGLVSRARGWLSRMLSKRVRDIAAYMDDLPGLCPDPAHYASYAAMIMQARQQREGTRPEQAAQESARLAGAAAWLDGQVGEAARRPRRSAASEGAASLPDEVARLARALRPSAQRLVREHRGDVLSEHARSGGRVDPEHLQDEVLADLMRHPGEGRGVITWLPAEAFSAGPRRHLYELISQAIAVRQPVDPLIMAWHAARLHPAVAAEFVLGIAALATGPGTAEVLGRPLLAEYICTTRLGADWAQSPPSAQPVLPVPHAAGPELHAVDGPDPQPSTRPVQRAVAPDPTLPGWAVQRRASGRAAGQATAIPEPERGSETSSAAVPPAPSAPAPGRSGQVPRR